MLLIFSLFACHFAEGEVRSGFSSTSWSSTLSYTTDTGSTTTATTPPAPTGDTGVTLETGTSPTTSVEMVSLRYYAFEEDRQCWSVRDVERPASAWGDYIENHCDDRGEARDVVRYIADLGHCAVFSGRFVGDCAVDDPDWLQDCSVGGCCDYSRQNRPGCVIDPYYQTDTGL